MDLVASDLSLSNFDRDTAAIAGREYLLLDLLKDVKANYDFILIDCPPSLGLITTNALTAADTILIPIQCEYYALEGLSQLMNTVRRVRRTSNPLLEIEGVLLTMYDGRLNLTHQVVHEIKRYFPKKVYHTVIPRTVRLSEAPSFGQPVQYYDKSSKGANAYNILAEEVIKANR
jgi:chromosome partitioning protein